MMFCLWFLATFSRSFRAETLVKDLSVGLPPPPTSHGESGGFFAKSKGQPHTDKEKWHISFFFMEKVPGNLKSLHQEMVVMKWLAVRNRNIGAGWSLSTPYRNSSRSSESVHSPYPNLKPSEKNWFIRDIGLKDGPFRRVKCYKPIQVYRFFKTTEQRKKPGCLDNYLGIIINHCKETCTAFFLVACIMKECSFFRFTQWGSGCS